MTSMMMTMHSRSLLSKSNDELNHKYGLIGEDHRRSTILDDQPSAKSRKVNYNIKNLSQAELIVSEVNLTETPLYLGSSHVGCHVIRILSMREFTFPFGLGR